MTNEPTDVVIVGAGSLGMLVLDCLVGDARWACKGFIDDGKAAQTLMGLPVFAGDSYDPGFCRAAVLAVGYPATRRRMVERLAHLELDWITFLDRRSLVGPGAMLGRGVVVLSFAMVASGVRIGDFSYVSSYAHAGAGSTIGAFTSLMGGATVGDSVIGDGCTLGLKSACLDGAVVGDGASVAPYTHVRKSVPAHALVAGSPARVVRQLSAGSDGS